MTVRDVYRALDERYPFAHRAEWDNVGILAGDPDGPADRILVALDATPASARRCLRSGANLLVTHHPPIHTPLRAVLGGRSAGSPLHDLIRGGVAVLSAHTNADVAPGGVSHAVARRLRLARIRPLIPGEPSDACKLVVFVPPAHAEAVMEAVDRAGGGRIGAYSRCSFRLRGTGTFLPRAGARPFLGRRGRVEEAEEIRFETVVPSSLLSGAIRAVREAHPYEEPAIEAYPLRGGVLGGGVGAIGERERPGTLDEVLEEACRRLRLGGVRVAGSTRRRIGKVAVVAGSGAEFAGAARDAGADLFLTGDLKYHAALEAAHGGMPVADIGHGAAESWILPEFRRTIVERFGKNVSVRIYREPEPFRPYRPGEKRGGRS